MQPDSIIPDQTNPQSWNRFSYVENDPINYADASGGFKCKDNSASFEDVGESCKQIIETYLSILEEEGGEEGKALVEEFRKRDNACPVVYRCKDQITITVNDGGTIATYGTDGSVDKDGYLIPKDNNFHINSSMMKLPDANNVGDLSLAGVFGHEIDHMIYGAGGLYDEIHAYSTQYTLYQNMGIDDEITDSNVVRAKKISAYSNASAYEIITADWARITYGGYPLYGDWRSIFDRQIRDYICDNDTQCAE